MCNFDEFLKRYVGVGLSCTNERVLEGFHGKGMLGNTVFAYMTQVNRGKLCTSGFYLKL